MQSNSQLYQQAFHPGSLENLSFLVTGGAGFIGSHIVEYLLKYKAAKVRVLDNLSTGFRQNLDPFFAYPNFEFVEGDISDAEVCMKACEGMDYVSHQAALGSVPRSINDPLATNNSNVSGFLNILNAARLAAVKRMVYASSSSVYGDSPHLPKREAVTGEPLSPYAVSKKVNEFYANVFHKVYGMQVAGLRYFNIFGPRQSPEGPYAAAIPLFMNACMKNESPFINGDGEQSRDFTFVENAVQANIKALFSSEEEIRGKVLNIACGERTTINELFYMIKEIAQSNCEPVYREERSGDVKHSLADISLANKLTGYEPSFRIKEGLRITYEWFKSRYS
jgi:UDP-N-acetylglucosamine/UDP-N-acetylgalactosamine 4-epimerase